MRYPLVWRMRWAMSDISSVIPFKTGRRDWRSGTENVLPYRFPVEASLIFDGSGPEHQLWTELWGRKVRIVSCHNRYLDRTGALLSNLLFVRAVTALIVLNVGSIAGAQRVVDQGIVIENVTVISPEGATPLLRADVVIRDGRIVEVGTNLVAGPHAARIDGKRAISHTRTDRFARAFGPLRGPG